MKKLLAPTANVLALVAIMLVSFTATAFAAGAATNPEDSLLELLRPVYDAFAAGHYVAAGALAVVLAVAALKRYAPGRLGAFLKSDPGGVLATLAVSFAGAVAASTADGQAWAWGIAWRAGGIAFAAAGGYAMIKKLAVEPLLASSWYQTRAPAWFRAAMRVVLWIFDKPAATAEVIREAEAAGEDAVEASPSAGAEGIAGRPEKF